MIKITFDPETKTATFEDNGRVEHWSDVECTASTAPGGSEVIAFVRPGGAGPTPVGRVSRLVHNVFASDWKG